LCFHKLSLDRSSTIFLSFVPEGYKTALAAEKSTTTAASNASSMANIPLLLSMVVITKVRPAEIRPKTLICGVSNCFIEGASPNPYFSAGRTRYSSYPFEQRDFAMATIELRDLHLVKKALAIAVLTIERQTGPLQSGSDQHDMKLLLDRFVGHDGMEHYTRSAWIAVTGTLPPNEL
jgi:hypothetical protein